MPRLFRESPVNSIWEGSGNVQCLDMLRAMRRDRGAVETFMAEVQAAAGADRRLDQYVAQLGRELADAADIEYRARGVVEKMALALQGSLLVRYGHSAVADAFCASRLTEKGSGNVQCLDVLRAMRRDQGSVEIFMAEAQAAAGANRRLDHTIAQLGRELADPTDIEYRARAVVEKMALALQGSLLVRYGNPAVADAFCASRLAENSSGLAYGTLPRAVDCAAILQRATPPAG